MGHEEYLCTIVATLVVCVTAPNPQPCTQPPLHVWPLGPVMNDLDIVGNTRGTVGHVTVGSLQPAIGYESTNFTGDPGSFISVTVDSYTPIDDLDDYAFQFYVKFDNVTQGTILSFESNSYDGTHSTTEIRKFQLEVSNGDIFIIVTDFGRSTLIEGIAVDTWYHLVLMRDKNQEFYSIFLNHNNQKTDGIIHKDLADAPTVFPASVVIGQNGTEGSNPLLGELACLQFVPCKSPFESTYDDYCIPAAWPDDTSTIITSTTTNAPTSTTAATTTSMDSSMTNSSNVIISTTNAPPAAATTNTPTILSTEINGDGISSGNAVSDVTETVGTFSATVESCMQYEVVANMNFGNQAEILDTVFVATTKNCAYCCNSSPSCRAFTFDGTMCTLGTHGATVFSAGSKLYIRTP